MKNSKSLLEKSIQKYQTIFGSLQDIERIIQNPEPEQVRVLSKQLQDIQDDARKTDQQLFPNLGSSPEILANPLFKELVLLIEKVVEMNAGIIPKIKANMAVQKDELRKLAGGKTIMSGYHGSKNKTGLRINITN